VSARIRSRAGVVTTTSKPPVMDKANAAVNAGLRAVAGIAPAPKGTADPAKQSSRPKGNAGEGRESHPPARPDVSAAIRAAVGR